MSDYWLPSDLLVLRSFLDRVRRHVEAVRCSAYVPHRADDMKFVVYHRLQVYLEEARRTFGEQLDQVEMLILADACKLETIEYDLRLVTGTDGTEVLVLGHLGERNQRQEIAWRELQTQRETCERDARRRRADEARCGGGPTPSGAGSPFGGPGSPEREFYRDVLMSMPWRNG